MWDDGKAARRAPPHEHRLTHLPNPTEAIREQLATLEAPPEVDFTVNQERLHAFLADMDKWIREEDVVRRKTLLRGVFQ
jgi:hypothetical protein